MIDFLLGFESGLLAALGAVAGGVYLSRRRATRQLDDARKSAEKATNEIVSVMQNIAAMNGAGGRPPLRYADITRDNIVPLKQEPPHDQKV